MASMVDELLGTLGQGGLDRLAGTLGVESDQVQGALGAALPALLEGLGRNASSPEGADALHSALNDHDGSLLDAGDPVAAVDAEDGSRILGHVFGGQRASVEHALAERTGSSPGLMSQLLPILAPMVLQWLGKRQQQGGLDTGGLNDLLGQQRQQSQQSMPDIGDLLGGILGGGSGGGMMDMVSDALGGGDSSGGGAGGGLSDLVSDALGGGDGPGRGSDGSLSDMVTDAIGGAEQQTTSGRRGGGIMDLLKNMLGGRR